MWILAIIAVLWVVCSVLEYGYTWAYVNTMDPKFEVLTKTASRSMCIIFGIAGPLSMVSTLAMGWGKYGLKFK